MPVRPSGRSVTAMEASVQQGLAGPHRISLWRDYDQAVNARAVGMSLGAAELTADAQVRADELYAAGARRVSFDGVVDLDGPDVAGTVRALALIRDLTGCGAVVSWQLRMESDEEDDWRTLSHLYPPSQVIGRAADGDEIQADWAGRFHLAKCVFRRGPGLIQVRDRRWSGLRRVTIVQPDYLEAVALLHDGTSADAIPLRILADLARARLIGLVGEMAWWLPYRVRRWPRASSVI